MDFYVHNIKTFVSLVSAPKKHTAHKTMRAPCVEHGQALRRVYKLLPEQCFVLGGLLNVSLMAVDFANYRETNRFFAFIRYLSGCRFYFGCWLIYLSTWQCYIAKYP